MYDIRFPNLGIVLHNVKEGFSVFGFEIKFYGIIIALGFLFAFFIIGKEAKRTGQNEEMYLDLMLWMMIPSIIGARLYYVLFSWKDYFQKGRGIGETLLDLINIRNGGLAIYGGVIAGVIVLIVFCKKKQASFALLADTAVLGLLIGQIMGRWGNFFNREAFGDYTDSLFAMAIPTDYFAGNGSLSGLASAGVITPDMVNHLITIDNMQWISVHPTFLYESLWNLALFIILLIYRKHKKFDGEIFLMYLWGYGMGRVWIEGLRSDSLMLPFGNMRVSQLIAAICVLTCSVLIVSKRLKNTAKS
ncbi:MAG: prolipoprotein diacylglyceryl transferase [Wujia sp.]